MHSTGKGGTGNGKYLLALYASPRKGGNTSLLLDSLVRGARESGLEVVDFRLADMDVRPCRGCNACSRDGNCIQKDEMQLLYPHLVEAECVALAAPVFSMHLCAQAKIVIDRCQPFWALKYVLHREPVPPEAQKKRKGFFLSCCGREAPDTFDCIRPTMAYFFRVVGVGEWEAMTYAGVDEKGDILKVAGALDRARAAGAEAGRARPGKA
jgi:multimeric flavodoxin WrbA